MPLELTRRLQFSASHRLHSPHLSEEENIRLYGICHNKYGHGHNYELEVTIQGEPDPKTGLVMNLSELNTIVKKSLIDKVDHHHFNMDVPFMKDIIPSLENIAIAFWNVLDAELPQEGC